ncbi:MAG: AAA family ATPase [Candidatus Pacebacteria bacterium]|nr:AAA family ATPase [Candidatus Paceibacterota bacterium]
MIIKKIEIENFRLLEDVLVSLNKEVTLIVGRNNSGKTSLTEIFYKFLDKENANFIFEDFSISACNKFEEAFELYEKYIKIREENANEEILLVEEEKYKNKIPSILLRIFIEYDIEDNLSLLSNFIMDLDDKRRDVLISCEYSIENTEKMFEDFIKDKDDYNGKFLDFIKKNYKKYYKNRIFAVNEKSRSHKKKILAKDIENVFLTRFIYAQNKLDDQAKDNTKRLSKAFEDYYSLNQEDKDDIKEIERVLKEASMGLDENYETLFKDVFTDLECFGFVSEEQKLKIKSKFEPEKVIRGNTQIFYECGQDLLPESHNGLGYSKLIFIILNFISFYEEYLKKEPKPEFQLLFIEEPEVHLHPQMQQVFIKNIKKFIKSKVGWNVQIVITTHSSHIISESEFDCIRYFDISEKKLLVKNLSDFEQSEKVDVIKFLKQYMSLNRCDMFFADKIILIEGAVERVLLPKMIKKDAEKLQSQYISIIEVGGAYAHNFKKLLEFLNVKTLIITDIDSIDNSKNRKACDVGIEDRILTSNKTLITWIPKKEKISELLKQTDTSKVDKKIRVAYQVPGDRLTECGRSFEQAFILENLQSVLDNKSAIMSLSRVLSDYNSAEEIKKDSYNIASKISKKIDFAFDIMKIEGWNTPKYIKDGLAWLKD